MYATRFGLYLGHPQACQHKTLNRKIQFLLYFLLYLSV